jgi:hypothetical protein
MKIIILFFYVGLALFHTCWNEKYLDYSGNLVLLAPFSQSTTDVTSLRIWLDFCEADSIEVTTDSTLKDKIRKPPRVLNLNDKIILKLGIENRDSDSICVNVHPSTFGFTVVDSSGSLVSHQLQGELKIRSSNWLEHLVVLSPGERFTLFKAPVLLKHLVASSRSKHLQIYGFYWNRIRSINDIELVVGSANSRPLFLQIN